MARLPGEADPPGDEDSTLLFTPPDRTPATALAAVAIPGYRLIRLLGEGGMGRVYEVEQQSPRRSIALKVLRPTTALSEHNVRLFQREIQTLARLKHPGIAAIHEAGATSDGLPYYTMELVRGLPLDRFREQYFPAPVTRQDLTSRLRLFQEICRPVAYAHRNGVIHRDLKPANVMIVSAASGDLDASGASPEIRLLDFGLARLVDFESEGTRDLSVAGVIQGTLAYMSPEQVRGNVDEIDVRSDIYALGSILYELLLGIRPHEFKEAGLTEIARRIETEEPPSPSRIVPFLRGDLETILRKALEKEPARRYQSVTVFQEDIERFLGNLPILARPADTAYQVRKLLARHRVAALGGLTLLALIVGFGITMSVLYSAEQRQRAAAEHEAHKARSILEYLQEMLVTVNPARERQSLTVREFLDGSAPGVDAALSDHPDTRAALHRTIGVMYRALGSLDPAEDHLRRAAALEDALIPPSPIDQADAHAELGVILLERGRAEEAEQEIRAALKLRTAHLAPDDPRIIASLNDAGRVHQTLGRLQDARRNYADALARMARLPPERQALLPEITHNLASLEEQLGHPAAAESLYRAALSGWSRSRRERQPAFALSLNNLADALQAQGRLSEAEEILRRALAEQTQLFRGQEHPDLLATWGNLALVLTCRGQFAEADTLLRRALAGWRRLDGERGPRVVSALNNRAYLCQSRGRLAAADSLYREALFLSRLSPDDWQETAQCLFNLGRVDHQLGRRSEARRKLEESARIRSEKLGVEHSSAREYRLALAALEIDEEAWEPAAKSLIGLVETFRREGPLSDELLAMELTIELDLQGGGTDALAGLTRLETRLDDPGVTIVRLREILGRVERLYLRLGRVDGRDRIRSRLERLPT